MYCDVKSPRSIATRSHGDHKKPSMVADIDFPSGATPDGVVVSCGVPIWQVFITRRVNSSVWVFADWRDRYRVSLYSFRVHVHRQAQYGTEHQIPFLEAWDSFHVIAAGLALLQTSFSLQPLRLCQRGAG